MGILEQKQENDSIGAEAMEIAWSNGIKLKQIPFRDIEIYSGYRRVYACDFTEFLEDNNILPW